MRVTDLIDELVDELAPITVNSTATTYAMRDVIRMALEKYDERLRAQGDARCE
jgi:hypothetical protein